MAGTVIGSLRVDLGLDSAQFQSGAQRAQTQMKGLQASTQQLQRTTNGLNFRMLLPQLSQVAQQTAATGQPMRALAVQAADIGLAFGPMGIAIGAIAGLALPTLVQAFSGGANAAETFATAAKATDGALSELNSTIGSVSNLEKDYREAVEAGNVALADRIAKLIELRTKEAELLALSLPQQIREQAAAMRELESATLDARDAYEEANAELQRLEQISRDPNAIVGGGFANELRAAQEAVQQASEAYVSLSRQAEIARVQTEQTRIQLDMANDILGEAVARTSGIASGMLDTATATAQAVLEAAGLDATMSQASVRMSAAAANAWGIASALRAAVAEAAALASVQTPVGQSVVLGGVRPSADSIVGTTEQRTAIIQATQQIDRYQASLEAAAQAANGGGGGGGGTAGAIEEVADISEVLTRILHEFNTNEAQEYRDTLQGIADDGIGGIADALADFAETGFTDFTSLMDGLVDAAADAVAQITAEFASAQLASSLGMFAGPVGGLIGGVAGGLLGGLFGGGGGQPYEGSEQQQIDKEKAALVRQQRELEGQERLIRLAELEQLDESNRALQEHIWALEDQAEAAAEAERQLAEAAAEAERVAAEAAALQAQISAERLGLERELLTVLGDTEALRALQLESLDESNRALQEQIWAEQDRAAAVDETTRALEEAIAAITTDKYANAFAYQRDLALAANGLLPANSTFAPTTISPAASAAQNSTSDPVVVELQAIKAKINALEARTYKWDREGLPEERTA